MIMLKIYDDKHYTLRARAELVAMPLGKEDEILALEMLKHIEQSQDEEFAAK